MYAVGRLIYRYITKNKGRALFIGFSILLSAAMIFILQVSTDDVKKHIEKNYTEMKGGKLTCSAYTSDKEYMDKLKDIDIVENVSYVLTTLKQFYVNEGDRKVELIGFQDNVTELLNFTLVEGKYPQNNNEIALEKSALDNMVNQPKIGETIKLKDIKNKSNKEMEYVLVGTFNYINKNGNNKSVSLAYVVLNEAERILKEDGKKKMNYECLIETSNKLTVEEIDAKLGGAGVVMNYDSTSNSRAIYVEGGRQQKVVDIMSIIIIIAVVLTLYNIFNSSITIKKPEFGMLKAIGMKDSELVTMIMGEGLILGVIFIGVGIAAGQLGYEVIKKLLDVKTIGYGSESIAFRPIVFTYIVCIIGIIVSIYGSSRKVMEQSAIEDIMGNDYLDIGDLKRENEKEIGESPKKFISDIAKCNIKRNRKILRMTVLSIAISVIVPMASYYLQVNFISVEKKSDSSDFIIKSMEENEENQISKEQVEEISNIEGVKSVYSKGIIYNSINLSKHEDKLDKDGIRYIEKELNRYKTQNVSEYMEKKYYYIAAQMQICNMEKIESLKGIVSQGSIDEEKLKEEPTCILVQNINSKSVTKYKVGDKISISDGKPFVGNGGWQIPDDEEFTIGAILDEDKFDSDNMMCSAAVIISDEVNEKYFSKAGHLKRYSSKQLTIDLKDQSYSYRVEKDLRNMVEKDGRLEFISNRDLKEKEVFIATEMLFYTLVVAIGACSIFSIFSIMSMNIILRKKEFAMYRAIGMSNREVKKLILRESFIYGIEGIKRGTIAGSIIVFIQYALFNVGRKIVCIYPVKVLGITIVSVIIVCILSSISAWRIVLKGDIISSIRAVE